jgi:hypothetical protein
MPISKKQLMRFEIVVGIILCCVGVCFLVLAASVSGWEGLGNLIVGGGCLIEGLTFTAGAALLRLKGRLAWSGQFLIIAFALLGMALFLAL